MAALRQRERGTRLPHDGLFRKLANSRRIVAVELSRWVNVHILSPALIGPDSDRNFLSEDTVK